MTSQVSSVNKKKTKSAFWVNFSNNFKSHWGIPAAIFAFLTLFYPVTSLVTIKDILKAHSNLEYKISEHLSFLITNKSLAQEMGVIVPFVIIFAGILLASNKFKFMNNKKEVNVFYSLGITRTKLFLSTYLAGFVQIILSVILPMLAVWIINISYFGGSKELTSSILYLMLSSIVLATYSYTITTLVSSKVGSNSEVIIYSIFLAFLPDILLLAVTKLLELFVLGSIHEVNGSNCGPLIDESYTLSKKLAYLKPEKCLEQLGNISMIDQNKNIIFDCNYSQYADADMVELKWIAPKLTRALGWFITSIVLCFTSTYTINKRPAEIAGFFGADKKTNAVMSFLFSFSFSLIVVLIADEKINGTLKLSLIGLLAFILTYIIFNAILTRKKKPFLKALKKLPIHVAILVCIALIFVTGLFGYSSKVPEIEDVKSVDMVIPSGRTLGLSTSQGADVYDCVSLSNVYDCVYDFEDKKDIEMITDLHKKIIKDGKVSPSIKQNPKDKDYVLSSKIVFKYKLKNGKTLIRSYNTAQANTLKEFLTLENSNRYKKLLKEAMINNSKLTEKSENPLGTMFKDNNYNVYLVSKHQEVSNATDLSDKQKQELVNCMYKDLTENSSNEINRPSGETLGSIQLYKDGYEFTNPDDEENYSSDGTYKNKSKKQEFQTYHLHNFNNTTDTYKFIVTTDMKNTLKFLEDNALLQYLDSKSKIVKAEIIDKRMLIKFMPYFINDIEDSYNFVGGKISKSELQNGDTADDFASKEFKKGYVTKDSSIIQKLDDNSYYTYFVPDNCYYVKYTLNNNNLLIMCIPNNKLPSNIKTVLDKKVID